MSRLEHVLRFASLTRLLCILVGLATLCLVVVQPVYAQGSTFTQSDYRWYQNRDNRSPNTPLANQNTAISGVASGTVIRLRMNVLVTTQNMAAGSHQFKLQYSTSQSGPWTDVGAIGSGATWRGYNNASVTDGDTLQSNNRLLSNSNVAESYEEQNPSAVNPRAVNVNQRGEWDWVLQNNNAPSSTTYYFRMVLADGTAFSAYTNYPQATSAAQMVLTQDTYRWFQNRDGIDLWTALANENTAYNTTGLTGQYRLRMNILVSNVGLGASSLAFKLQYATSQSGPWSDVGAIGSGTTWRGYDNASIADGATIDSWNVELSNSNVAESYEEQNNSANNPRAVSAGQRGEWDWVLDANNIAAGTTYHFRMTKSDGTPLDSYTLYPTIVAPSPSTLTQSNYRWYQNRDGTQVYIALAAENTTANASLAGSVYRLRMNILASGATVDAGTKAFKLQYATSQAGPWSDVGAIGSGTIWRGFNNPVPSDGAALDSWDIVLSNSNVAESYEEQNDSAANPRAIIAGQRGEWDWVLEDNGISASVIYYFRTVNSNGTPLDGYNQYPAINTANLNYAPVVNSVTLAETDLVPQMEYTVSVSVSDSNTINNLSTVQLKLWFDSDGGTPTVAEYDSAIASAQNCATITWIADNPGGNTYTGYATLQPAGTTWSLGSSTLPQGGGGGLPGDFGLTSFTFQFRFTVGKVATQSIAAAKWQIAAKATDAGSATAFGYDGEGAAMSFYGEISGLTSVTVDWGTMNVGTDFTNPSAQRTVSATVVFIANGPYDKLVKASSPWSNGMFTATLDPTGACAGGNLFALKANDIADLNTAALVNTVGVVIDDSGLQTTETGNSVSTVTLWLKVASTFSKSTYTGIITFLISNGS